MHAGVGASMWWLAAAWGADWVALQGTEPIGAEAVRPWGFVQPVAEALVGVEPVTGLSPGSAHEGEVATFGVFGSGDATFGMSLHRARLGMRGVVPLTEERVNWLVAAELGDGGLTRTDPVVLTDASVTASYVPGVRVRLGQFKLPLGEEALEANAVAAEFVNFSAATASLLVENPIAEGAYTGGSSGTRDVGVQVFDAFAVGRGEVSYAVMLSNGRMGALDLDDAKDVTARITVLPWVWGDRHATQRDELGVWAFRQQGQRTVDGEHVPRVRQGVGVKLERLGWQVRGELLHATGALEVGAALPFRGEPLRVEPDGEGLGGYVYVHRETTHLGAGVRYDALHQDLGPDVQVRRTLTVDLQAIATPRARLLVDYELRRLAVPSGDADARAIATTFPDRVSLQAVVVF